jgi:hypothetical protein
MTSNRTRALGDGERPVANRVSPVTAVAGWRRGPGSESRNGVVHCLRRQRGVETGAWKVRRRRLEEDWVRPRGERARRRPCRCTSIGERPQARLDAMGSNGRSVPVACFSPPTSLTHLRKAFFSGDIVALQALALSYREQF